MKITLASLDLFWLAHQARILQAKGFLDHFFTTRVRPEAEGIEPDRGSSCLPLHYGLRVLQRHWSLLGGNLTYLQLCRLFDSWLEPKFSRETDVLAVLSGAGLKSFRAARRAGVRTVVECGSTHPNFQHAIVIEEFRRNGITRPLFPESYLDRVRTEFDEVDFIQIPSRFVGATFLENGIAAGKLLYATYGVDVGRFPAKDEPAADGIFRAICPSGVNLRKGARVLAEAWQRLDLPRAELHWIGASDATTQHLFRDKPASIVFHAWMSHADLAALYRKCDVFVLPSFEEGFARVMLEAAASGLPLLVTPNTGVEDFFTPGEPEGWLLPAGDVHALCEAFHAAADDPNQTFVLGQRAAQKAQSFSWDAYGEQVLANYCRVLALP